MSFDSILNIVLSVIRMLVMGYIIMLSFRIILTWFEGTIHPSGKIYDFLYKATNPYINFFRRLKLPRFGALDISIIAGITCLYIIYSVLGIYQMYHTITVGIILSVILLNIWYIIRFFSIILLVLTGIKFFIHSTRRGGHSPFMMVIDQLISPFQYKMEQLVPKTRSFSYSTQLIIIGCLFLVIIFPVTWGIETLAILLTSLPV